jgi:regulator of protease activity HflC (stomatin/prohibitin superfamily)
MFRGSNNVVAFGVVAIAAVGAIILTALEVPWFLALAILPLALSPRQVKQWERGVVLRLGRFYRVLEPGISWVIPGPDSVANLVDMRIRSTAFTAESTLTQDTVPVNVDAVLFWEVHDAEKAILDVGNYLTTVVWAAQTTLRDVIGRSGLFRMISDREALDEELRRIIDEKTSRWGVQVTSVELRDVVIPKTLEDAMSRKAQAERESEARIILAEAEEKIADEMNIAARKYGSNAIAMQLRAMNITYESIKESGALMVIPSGMADAINPGVLGLAASGLILGGSPEPVGA